MMFSISLSEIAVILIIALVVFDKKEVTEISSYLAKLFRQIREIKRSAKAYMDEIAGQIEQEEKPIIRKIIGDDGKEYISYDLDHIKPDILKNIKDEENNKS